ncbi:MAG: histidine triad nucleotide-binding protein [Gammaproteobacteria bacterium]|nr:histidine triad nucleotide-binding protein [Gammaproteobacteria bacterium]
MSEPTLFERIIAREIPADIVYEDERVIAFRDINPQAPMHILVCPKKPIPKVADAAAADDELLGYVLRKAGEIATAEGHGEGFRLVLNNGAPVGQTVFHIHVHVLGGRGFGWPPG